MPAFADCTLLSLSRLRGLGQFEYTPSRPADVVHQLVWDMDHLPTHALERAALVSHKEKALDLCCIISELLGARSAVVPTRLSLACFKF